MSPRFRCILVLIILQDLGHHAAFVQPPVQKVTGQCFESGADFEAYCNQLNGVTNGGRCYFYAATNVGWKASWSACQAYGATLPQVHTGSEHKLMSDYGRATFGDVNQNIWLPLADIQTGGQVCKLFANSTFWYSSETEKISNPPIEKGYLYRYHRCEGVDAANEGPPRCMLLFQYTPHGPLMNFGDWYCEPPGSAHALCEFSNSAQNYTLSVGKCLGEDPIESIAGQEALDCAGECSQRQWCRSFNFIQGSSSPCELFTWSIVDTNVTKVNSQCQHYNYVE